MPNEENEKKKADAGGGEADFSEIISKKQHRKLKARKESERSLWFGLGMFGLVGWSVAVPTVIGVFIGVWMDQAWPGRPSWTLTLLILGVIVGCLNAWFWVKRESEKE